MIFERSGCVGATTSPGNAALLCSFHHAEVHTRGGWAVHMAPDGLPTFIPPRRVDPQQRPRRNRYHRRQ